MLARTHTPVGQKTHILCMWHPSQASPSSISSPIIPQLERQHPLTVAKGKLSSLRFSAPPQVTPQTLNHVRQCLKSPNTAFRFFWSACQEVKDSLPGKSSCSEDVFSFYLHIFLMRVKVNFFFFSGISWDSFLATFSFCLIYGFADRPEGSGAEFFLRLLLSKCERGTDSNNNNNRFTFLKKRENQKGEQWWNWGSSWSRQGKSFFLRGRTEKTTATTARSVHTHTAARFWGQIWSQIFPLIPHSDGFYAAQWVEIDADTAEVTGFVSHRDKAKKHLHIWRIVICCRVYICHVHCIDKSEQLWLVNKFNSPWSLSNAVRIIISITYI